MSILTRVIKVILKVTVKALLKDASKINRKVEKIGVSTKLHKIDKHYVAERAKLRTKAEQYKKKAIETHGKAEAEKRAILQKVNIMQNEALNSQKLATKIEDLLK